MSNTPDVPNDERCERIVAAAILDPRGVINTMRPPARHHTLIHAMVERGDQRPISDKQGFITSSGRFVTRREAAAIAFAAGQMPRDVETLFSEDLW